MPIILKIEVHFHMSKHIRDFTQELQPLTILRMIPPHAVSIYDEECIGKQLAKAKGEEVHQCNDP